MQWEVLERRQSVTQWRDQLILEAHNLFNEHAILALEAFEREIGEATVLDSVWDPAGFANSRIDGALARTLSAALASFFQDGAAELAALDPAFVELSEALRKSEAVSFPVTPVPADPPWDQPVQRDNANRPAHSTPEDQSAFSKTVGFFSARASAAFDYASDTASWLLQDKVGLRERLRAAAADRIATAWMGKAGHASGGTTGEPRAVLKQVIALIDEVARAARTSLL